MSRILQQSALTRRFSRNNGQSLTARQVGYFDPAFSARFGGLLFLIGEISRAVLPLLRQQKAPDNTGAFLAATVSRYISGGSRDP